MSAATLYVTAHAQRRGVWDIALVSETLLNQFSSNMSIVFVPKKLRGTAKINQETIQRVRRHMSSIYLCTVHVCGAALAFG